MTHSIRLGFTRIFMQVEETVEDIKATPNRLKERLIEAAKAALKALDDRKNALLLEASCPIPQFNLICS